MALLSLFALQQQLVQASVAPPVLQVSHGSYSRVKRTSDIVLSHKKKPKRLSQPAPSYMPASSYSRVKSTWRHTGTMASDAGKVPALQTQLPPRREGERIPVGRYPALVLNADYQPLSMVPVSLWSWQDTVRAVCRGCVTVLSCYDVTVRSPSTIMALPSVSTHAEA